MGSEGAVSADDVARAREAIRELVVRTPLLSFPSIDARAGGRVALKCESLQHSGSFKLRGASAKLAASPQAAGRGVVAGTAGNHGQAVAMAARRLGAPCDLFVPIGAPVSKIAPAAALGARVHTVEGTVDDCVEAALAFSQAEGSEFVHPFDDPTVVAGQGTVGLELLEQAPELARVVVPLGGGGLAAGTAIAIKSERPEVEVVGVQIDACAAYPRSLEAGEPVAAPAADTVADGIAVKRPGRLTLPLVREWVDRVVVVGEDEAGDAMGVLLGEAKLVVEGAGAVGLAALASEAERPAPEGVSAVVLSGGNVDEELLAAVARRSETRQGRGVVLFTTISDRPGSLARLLDRVAATGASVVDVRHIREGVKLGMGETGVELILETRGRGHAEQITAALERDGYRLREVVQPEEERA
jgi:threonine dehydratase